MSSRQVLRRGACPGVVDAMEAADGLLLRLRLPGGAIDAPGLRALARLTATLGNGIVEITSRANLQVRGVAADDLGVATDRLVHAGLSTGDAVLDARRAVVAPALLGHDGSALVDARPHLAGVVEELAAAVRDLPLPAKFSVVLDDGSALGVGDVGGDVVLVPKPGEPLVALRARLRAAVLATAAGEAVPVPTERHPGTGPVVGVHPHPDARRANVIAAPALGRLDDVQLHALADIADHDEVRLTHRRGVAVAGVARDRLRAVVSSLAVAGLSVDADDPVHGVTACAGAPGCASSLGDTQAGARARIARRAPGAPPVHLAGCEKRCGAPAGARVLVAQPDGRFEAAR